MNAKKRELELIVCENKVRGEPDLRGEPNVTGAERIRS